MGKFIFYKYSILRAYMNRKIYYFLSTHPSSCPNFFWDRARNYLLEYMLVERYECSRTLACWKGTTTLSTKWSKSKYWRELVDEPVGGGNPQKYLLALGKEGVSQAGGGGSLMVLPSSVWRSMLMTTTLKSSGLRKKQQSWWGLHCCWYLSDCKYCTLEE